MHWLKYHSTCGRLTSMIPVTDRSRNFVLLEVERLLNGHEMKPTMSKVPLTSLAGYATVPVYDLKRQYSRSYKMNL